MKGQEIKEKPKGKQKVELVTNLLLCAIIASIGIFALSPETSTVTTDGEEGNVYRSASATSDGVSLMFNVYWGTEEVYEILSILERYDAKATFFIGGAWADDNVQCLKDIYWKGHEIGNHGYFHKAHEKLNVEQNRKEISDCNRFIELAIGEKPTLFEPPSGAYNDSTLTACKLLQMKTILWSRDTIDWRDKNAALIYTRATKNIKGGEFVLMHPMEATVDALEDIIKYYLSQSLRLVTVSENLQEKG